MEVGAHAWKFECKYGGLVGVDKQACAFEGSLNAVLAHEHTCRDRLIKCPHHFCTLSTRLADYALHEETCTWRGLQRAMQ
mmetsp:Transcript_18381/g.45125  ORF Transcript_18381/g.45125 Transcript_18381/m.45125 type:complete len:80 (-) Transcript_18381:1314-1553(-)